MDFTSLIDRGALLLAMPLPQTKKGREKTLELVEEWHSVCASVDGKLGALPVYKREALLYLNKRLREKRLMIVAVDVEED